jgi:uncharacterized protein (DUF3820 family)
MQGRALVDEEEDYRNWLDEQMTFEEMLASNDNSDLLKLASSARE